MADAPLYGTCVILTLPCCLISSPARFSGVPTPDDAYDSLPGCALASAISSAAFFAGRPGLPTSTIGWVPTKVTGARSFSPS
ncbi:hypothetical protein D3C72_1164610 [compost metagenome]